MNALVGAGVMRPSTAPGELDTADVAKAEMSSATHAKLTSIVSFGDDRFQKVRVRLSLARLPCAKAPLVFRQFFFFYFFIFTLAPLVSLTLQSPRPYRFLALSLSRAFSRSFSLAPLPRARAQTIRSSCL